MRFPDLGQATPALATTDRSLNAGTLPKQVIGEA